MESLILPGTASIFMPISGTAQECSTSPEVAKAFRGTPTGKTKGLSTSSSRLPPKLRELSLTGILSKVALKESMLGAFLGGQLPSGQTKS